jgi:pyruvate kinase
MPRRTKIVATLGPATDEQGVLDDMIRAGMDVARLNFSHGDPDEHLRRAEAVRERARSHGQQVGIFADLQGPRIRIERFRDELVMLEKGGHFTLDARLDPHSGTRERVGLS